MIEKIKELKEMIEEGIKDEEEAIEYYKRLKEYVNEILIEGKEGIVIGNILEGRVEEFLEDEEKHKRILEKANEILKMR
ncbi:MAG: hypothetical protein QW052_06250 [Candidatus Nitrosocaldaceae archaeon]